MLRAADDLAHRAFGDRLHGAFGILDVEQIVAGAVGLTFQNTEKSTSTMFSSPVSIRLSSGTSRMVRPRRADRRSAACRCRCWLTRSAFGSQHGLDRIRQVIVQAGLHIARHTCRSAARRRALRARPGRSRTSPRSRSRRAAISAMPGRRAAARQQAAAAGPGRGAADLRDRAASVRPIAAGAPRSLGTRAPRARRPDSSTASNVSCARTRPKPGLACSGRRL